MAAAIVALMSCATRKYTPVADFPPEMAENIRTEYMKIWEKGKVLYGMNCAECHSKKVGRNTVIPDFSREQLQGYELRVSNRQHEEHMPDEKVTAEELSQISVFLSYKKKTGIPMTVPVR